MKFYMYVMFLLSVVPSVQCAVFATPSWMHTASRNLEGRSLTATSAEDFKKKQLAAAVAEGKVVPLAATGAVAMTGMGVKEGINVYTSNTSHKYRLLEPLIIGGGMVASAAVYAANIPGALKRKKMHELHAKHADVLYALLQNSEFKKKMGVESWESVRRRRKKAEAIGLSVQTIGSVLAFFVMVVLASNAEHKGHHTGDGHLYGILTISGCALLPLLISLGAKPLIARLIRKKGGVEQLNKEFAKAIAAAEAKKKHKNESVVAVDAEPVCMVSL
ncbi:MAG: hypothetical protein WCJ17_00045 [bacterium]